MSGGGEIERGAATGLSRASTESMLDYAIKDAEERLVSLKRAREFLKSNPETAQFIDDLKNLGLR